MTLRHEDLCRLSRAFNEVANLHVAQDTRINEWLKTQIENVAMAQADGPKRQWEHDGPKGWNLNAAKFLALVQSCPMMWLRCSRAKYIELRVDTRDGGFNLYDRDHAHLSPDVVVAAIKDANEQFGECSSYRSEPAEGESK